VNTGLYDVVMRAADHAGLSRARASLVNEATGRVLEVGAGTGLQFQHYASGVSVIAIEPDVGMAEAAAGRARRAPAEVSGVAADAQALPFPDESFDSVVCALVFCSIPRPEVAAHEIRRVLRPGGVVHLLEHVRANHPALALLQELLTPMWKRVAGGCHLARRTVDLFGDAGFAVRVRWARLDGALVAFEARRSAPRKRATR